MMGSKNAFDHQLAGDTHTQNQYKTNCGLISPTAGIYYKLAAA